jgi:hypothetical protein
MQKESSGYPELELWYNRKQKELTSNPLLKFFNDRRVYSIHMGVVKPSVHSTPAYNIEINGAAVPGTGTMTVIRFEGVDEFIPGSSGNVFNMCEQYFLILKRLVHEWMFERQKYIQKTV